MNSTVSMWLGLAFLLLCVSATLLQAWLWGPPFWDAEHKVTRAPRGWLRLHAFVGYCYFALYVVMMVFMVPRLWNYQQELPARTVLHAVVALVIGVLLVCKIAIIKWFRHFEEAMPKFGFALLLSTVVLVGLSLPFAWRAHSAHDRTLDAANVARTRTELQSLGLPEPSELVTSEAFERGRGVLLNQCATCHDLRTVLSRPRTPQNWLRVVERMAQMPAVSGEPIDRDDVHDVTAYLIAITPALRERIPEKPQENTEEPPQDQPSSLPPENQAHVDIPPTPTPTPEHPAAPAAEQPEADDEVPVVVEEKSVKPTPEAEIPPAVTGATSLAAAEMKRGRSLLNSRCLSCHGMEEIQEHGGDNVLGWGEVIEKMIEEGAKISRKDAKLLARYLAQTHPL